MGRITRRLRREAEEREVIDVVGGDCRTEFERCIGDNHVARERIELIPLDILIAVQSRFGICDFTGDTRRY